MCSDSFKPFARINPFSLQWTPEVRLLSLFLDEEIGVKRS